MAKGPDIPEIKTKSLKELTSEAVSANISQLPEIAKAFAQFGPELGQAAFASFVAANPDVAKTMKQLGSLLTSRLSDAEGGQVPDFILAPFRERLRGGQAIRGVAESPISAVSEARELGEVAEGSILDTIRAAVGFSGTSQGGTPTLGDLGLDLPDIGSQIDSGVKVQGLENEALLENFALKRGRQKGKSEFIGSVVGAGIGLAVGNPLGGAAVGRQVGGTFF